jgi:hypothetical protein
MVSAIFALTRASCVCAAAVQHSASINAPTLM